jgi:hypothetical protein
MDFSDFSRRIQLPVDRFVRPGNPGTDPPPQGAIPVRTISTADTTGNLAALRAAVQAAEAAGQPIHAMGAGWAFSAPAYTPGRVVQTDLLCGFPPALQGAINNADAGDRVLAAVEAGAKVRDLSLALMGRPRRLVYLDSDQSQPAVPPNLWGMRTTFAPPTQGGAGGQTLAGALSTGTHGGDVRRGAVSDFVHAMILVGSGGTVRLIQRAPADAARHWPVLAPPHAPRLLPVVDVGRLRAGFPGIAIEDIQDTDAFNAAVVSVGRFGIVYAYVFEVHDESTTWVYEFRHWTTWSQVRTDYLHNQLVENAAAVDGFLQVVINPTERPDGDHKAYVTKHVMADRSWAPHPDSAGRQLVPDAGHLFGLASSSAQPIRAFPVTEARTPLLPGDLGQVLCIDHPTPETMAAASALAAVGELLLFYFGPLGLVGAIPCFEAASWLDQLSADNLLGDAMARVFNLATHAGFPQLLEAALGAVLDGMQAETVPHPQFQPWLVFGTRGDIADFFEYNSDCYRGDSIELFFPADDSLPDVIDEIFGTISDLRRDGIAAGCYISLRFMAGSEALLAPAGFSPTTCAVEVSMLTGLEGNELLLAALQNLVAGRHGTARLHWGQENDVNAGIVARLWPGQLDTFLNHLLSLEGASPTFSNPFSFWHGLEPSVPGLWQHWEDLNFIAASAPAVLSASAGKPLQVFAIDDDTASPKLNMQSRPAAAASSGWVAVKPETVGRSTPAAVRSVDGRDEVFLTAQDQSLQHIYQRGDGTFSDWDVLGAPWPPKIALGGAPAVAAHSDGRLEAFALERDVRHRMLHTCADWVNGPWGPLEVLGNEAISVQPRACLRVHVAATASDQLLAVSVNLGGNVVFKVQTGPGGTSGWTDWAELNPVGGAPFRAPGAAPLPLSLAGQVRVLTVDPAAGQVFEAIEADTTVALVWQQWQPLPALSAGRIDSTTPLTAVQAGSDTWLFGRSVAGTVMTIVLRGGAWQPPWINLGGRTGAGLAAGELDDGRVEVMAQKVDGSLVARRQVTAGHWT